MSGSLSTRVMNMKFMQKAENTKANENHEEQRRMLDDVSEWMLPHLAKILKMAQRKPKIEALGYGSIMNDRSYTTRKSWTNEKDVADSDDYDPSRSRQNELGELSTLWRKRKPDGSPNRDNKRRAT